MAPKHLNILATDSMHEQLCKAAQEQERSLSAQVRWYLQQGLMRDGYPRRKRASPSSGSGKAPGSGGSKAGS